MFYITTPIPYTNSQPHLGHLLESVFTDTLARFYSRSQTDSVFLQMGVDQHGLKIYEAAQKSGKDPKEFVDGLSQNFKKIWADYDIKYDEFIETSSEKHRIVAQAVWRKLKEGGYIYKKTYTGLYCKGCEDFYVSTQLVDGKCPIHYTELVGMNEENYFFRLSEFTDKILEFLQKADIKPDFIAKEQINFVNEGLNDISISREKSRLPWGISVPDDDTQVMYVWFEALINYLTAIVNPQSIDKIAQFPHQASEFESEIWADIMEALPINIMYISKEIAKFHLVIWIGILSALDLPLPERALAHGLINDSDGRKFSKSLGNGVLPDELYEKFGKDGTRFIMLHDINIDGDTSFDWKTIIDSYNSHLANNVGNLIMRVTTLVEKYENGLIDLDNDKLEKLFDFKPVYTHLNNLDTRRALDEVLLGARKGNEYLEDKKPWTLAKEGKTDEVREVLTQLCILIRDLAEAISIFMPETGEKIHNTITAEQITKASPLFQKVEISE